MEKAIAIFNVIFLLNKYEVTMCRKEDFFKHNKPIYEGPVDTTVRQGESVRFKCRVHSGIENIRVQWSINERLTGLWPPHGGGKRFGFSYPKDGDISLDVYDIELSSASWQKHDGSKMECQVIGIARSAPATLTVLVPPSRIVMKPASKDGVIVSDRSELISVECMTDFATHMTTISWTIDGNTPAPHEISSRTDNTTSNIGKTNLTKVTSRLSHPVITATNDSTNNKNFSYYREEKKIRKRDADDIIMENLKMRHYLESIYEEVYRVTCEANNKNLQRGINLKNSVWIVVERDRSHLASVATKEHVVYSYTNSLLISLGSVLFLAFTILLIGSLIIRRCSKERNSNQSTDHGTTTGKVIYIPDQGIASNADWQDRLSDGDTLRSGSNIHMLHGQAANTECITRFNDPTFNTFARGDGPTSTLESRSSGQSSRIYNGSIKSESFHALSHSNLRKEMMDYAKMGLYAKNYGSVPRGWNYNTTIKPIRTKEEMTPETKPVNMGDILLPPPPTKPLSEDTISEMPNLPSPMPLMGDLSCVILAEDLYPALSRYEPEYNVVQSTTYKPTQNESRIDGEGTSEPSPGSNASGQNLNSMSRRQRHPSSSLV